MNNYSVSGVPFFGVISRNQPLIEVYECKTHAEIIRCCNQRGFYKVCLTTGNNIIRYANKEIETKGASLFLCNAYTTYNWEFISEKQNAYACILTEDFLNMFDYLNVLQQSRLFGTNCLAVFSLKDEQKNFITDIFQMMISEQSTRYVFKEELMYTWVSLIVHEALKIKLAGRPSFEELLPM